MWFLFLMPIEYGLDVKRGRDLLPGCLCHLVMIGKIRPDECPEHIDTPYDQHRIPSPFQAPFNKNKTPQASLQNPKIFQNTKDPPSPLGGTQENKKDHPQKSEQCCLDFSIFLVRGLLLVVSVSSSPQPQFP